MRLMLTNALAMAACSAAIAQPCVPGWHSVGGGTGYPVSGLHLFDEGSKQVLIAGGYFNTAGGVTTGTVARWNGAEWSNMGGVYFDRWVSAMIVHDDGRGPALFVGGALRPVPGFDGFGVARWDGLAWSAVGDGLTAVDGGVHTFAVFDDGTGSALYAGGRQLRVVGYPPSAPQNLARWDGTAWVPFGGADGSINDMMVYAAHGSAPTLYLAGTFTEIGGITARGAASWDGHSWKAHQGSWSSIYGYGFAAFTHHNQEQLMLAGAFRDGSEPRERGLARWTGADWELVGTTAHAHAAVLNATVWDDGAGPAVYVSGEFDSIGGVASSRIARFDGTSWSAVGGGYPGLGVASAILGVDSGPEGRALYIGGSLISSIPGMGRDIARYDPCFVPCYANCDGSTTAPILNVEDFMCFINEFSAGMSVPHEQQIGHYANCDGSTEAPVLNVDDFVCFINAFGQGCL